MADLSILAGATSQSILVDLYILATGAPQTALVYNSTGLTAYYSFAGASAGSVQIPLVTLATTTTAYSSGGFIKIDDTNMPGIYRLDLPTGVLAAAKGREVVVTLTGFSGMATRHIKIELTGWDNQNANNGGLAVLPATAVPGAANGLFIAGTNVITTISGGLVITGTAASGGTPATQGVIITGGAASTSSGGTSAQGVKIIGGSGAASTNGAAPGLTCIAGGTTTVSGSDGVQMTGTGNGNGCSMAHAGAGKDFNATSTLLVIPTVTTVTNQLSASAIATGIWTDTTAGDFTTSASIGKSIMNGVALGTGLTINAYTGDTPQTGDSYARLGAPAGASVSADIAAVEANALAAKNSTAGLTFTVANKVDANTLAVGGTTQTARDLGASVLLSAGTGTGQVTLASGILTANVNGDLTATMKTSVTTACNAATTVGITSNRKKGATATFEFLMQDSTTGAPKTGLTVASTISKDGGASASTSNSVTEIGLGQYQIVLTNTEMTANNIFLQFTATGAITANMSIQTAP